MSSQSEETKLTLNGSNKYNNKFPFEHDDDEEIYTLSFSIINRLFYIWFNSISSNGITINFGEFEIILNKIFSSSNLPLTNIQIINIYKEICNKNDNLLYFTQLLSKNNDLFSNIMYNILENDLSAIYILYCIPNKCNNNPNNSTLQQILYDQNKEIQIMKKWIIEIGLPSHKRKKTLQKELTNILEYKSHLDMELKIVEEEKINLKSNADTISQSYSLLNDNYIYCKQEINNLKSINKKY